MTNQNLRKPGQVYYHCSIIDKRNTYDELDTLEIHESLLSGSFSEELCPIFEGNLTEPTVEVDSDFFI
jgi:hypothetical protein